MKKKYCVIGWRLNSRQKEELHSRGLYTYANRSWDEGCGCTLEHRVIVNHEADVITNWPALDEEDRNDFINDFYEYVALCEAEESIDFYKSIEDVINNPEFN